MTVENLIEVGNPSKYPVEKVIGSMLNALEENNMTFIALLNEFGTNKLMKKQTVVPFSSARKLSAVTFADGEGTYFLGAPEFVLPGGNTRTDAIIRKYMEQGYRVLMVGHSTASVTRTEKGEFRIPQTRKPVALIVIEDRIRPDAVETVRWFKQNDVEIKVISGDNPIAVSEIARKVGIDNAHLYISLDGMNEDQVADAASKYTVFGRVSPEQKAILVKALKNIGKTVAMTGDGVNDVLAMREADCSIAMAAGSEASRNVAHLVLVDNNFSSMPKVVAEGRRVVNNIQSAAPLYYMKIIFTIILTVFTLIADRPYPFNTSNVLLIEVAVVAIPTTLLALQPNLNIIKGNFLLNVMKRALPFALVFALQTAIIYTLDMAGFVQMENDQLETVTVICYTITGLFALYFSCKPLNVFRGVMCGLAALLTVIGIFLLGGIVFEFNALGTMEVLVVLVIIQFAFTLISVLTKAFDNIRLNK
jgi:cation-transporting ATPase E